MSPRALQHEYPRWEGFERDPTEDVYAWPGAPRFVSARRARKLRKRGVPLMPCHQVHDPNGEHRPGQFYPTTPGEGPGTRSARYAWFETTEHAEARHVQRRLRCYLVATRPQPFGRKGWLAARLEQQRLGLAAQWAARAIAKAAHSFDPRAVDTAIDELRRNLALRPTVCPGCVACPHESDYGHT